MDFPPMTIKRRDGSEFTLQPRPPRSFATRFDLAAELSQLQNFFIPQCLFAVTVPAELQRPSSGFVLDAQSFFAQCFSPDLLRDCVHNVAVRFHFARNQGFAQAKGGLDDRLCAQSAQRVGCEHYP